MVQKYNLLIQRFKSIPGSGENVAAAPNPANPQEVLVLNADQLWMWACDWVSGSVLFLSSRGPAFNLTRPLYSGEDAGVQGVDEITPPMHRAGWKYVPVTEYPQEKARLQGMARGLGDDIAPLQSPLTHPKQSIPSTTTVINS